MNDCRFEPSSWIVSFDDSEIVFSGPDDEIETILWKDLQCVRLEVVEMEGKSIPYLILDAAGWNVYQHPGFNGEEQLLSKLEDLPGFRSELLHTLRKSPKVGVYELWKRRDT